MRHLAGLYFYLQQTSDDRQLSFLPPLHQLTGVPHHLPGQRQKLVIAIAQALPTLASLWDFAARLISSRRYFTARP